MPPRKKGPEEGGIKKKKGKGKAAKNWKFPCPWPGCLSGGDKMWEFNRHHKIHNPDNMSFCAVDLCGFATYQLSNLSDHIFNRVHNNLSLDEYNAIAKAKQAEENQKEMEDGGDSQGSNRPPHPFYPEFARLPARRKRRSAKKGNKQKGTIQRRKLPTRTSSWTTGVQTDALVAGPSTVRHDENAHAFGERPFCTPQAPTNMLPDNAVNVPGGGFDQTHPGLTFRDRTPDVDFLNGNLIPIPQGGYNSQYDGLRLPPNALGLTVAASPGSDGGLVEQQAAYNNIVVPQSQNIQAGLTLAPITTLPDFNAPQNPAFYAAGGLHLSPHQLSPASNPHHIVPDQNAGRSGYEPFTHPSPEDPRRSHQRKDWTGLLAYMNEPFPRPPARRSERNPNRSAVHDRTPRTPDIQEGSSTGALPSRSKDSLEYQDCLMGYWNELKSLDSEDGRG